MRITRQKSDVNGYSKISMVIIVIMILLLGYIMGYPEVWYVQRAYKESLAAALESAREYISRKYGFEARMINEDKCRRDNEMRNDIGFYYITCRPLFYDVPESDGQSLQELQELRELDEAPIWDFDFDMEANGREFTVNVCIGSENIYISDNYQQKEIRAAALSEPETEISRSLPGGNILYFDIGDNYNYSYYSYFSKYYDGNNIDEILESSRGSIEAVFADADFSSPYSRGVIEKLMYEWGFDIRFTSFDRGDIMEEFLEHESTSSAIYDYDMYVPHITDFVRTTEGEEYFTDGYRPQSCGGLVYYSLYNEAVTEADESGDEEFAAKFAKIFEEYGEGMQLGTPLSCPSCLSGAYKINRSGTTYIYVPLERLAAEGVDTDDVGLAWYRKRQDDGYVCGIERAVICGDHAVFRMSFYWNYLTEDTTFMPVNSARHK